MTGRRRCRSRGGVAGVGSSFLFENKRAFGLGQKKKPLTAPLTPDCIGRRFLPGPGSLEQAGDAVTRCGSPCGETEQGSTPSLKQPEWRGSSLLQEEKALCRIQRAGINSYSLSQTGRLPPRRGGSLILCRGSQDFQGVVESSSLSPWPRAFSLGFLIQQAGDGPN